MHPSTTRFEAYFFVTDTKSYDTFHCCNAFTKSCSYSPSITNDYIFTAILLQ